MLFWNLKIAKGAEAGMYLQREPVETKFLIPKTKCGKQEMTQVFLENKKMFPKLPLKIWCIPEKAID